MTIGEERMQSTGAICQCGTIFAGLIKSEIIKREFIGPTAIHQKKNKEWIREVHLTNGGFMVLDMDARNLDYPILESEI